MVRVDGGTPIHSSRDLDRPQTTLPSRWARLGRLALASWILLACPVTAESLVSTSFEPDPEWPTTAELPPGWEFRAVDGTPDVLARWEAGTARDGERSLSIAGPGSRGALLGPRCPVAPGDWIRSSVWVRSWRLDGSAYLGIVWYDEQGGVIDEVRSGPGSGAERWRRCALEAPAPPGSVTLRPFLALEGSGMVWFDELRVIRRSEPPVRLVSVTASGARQGERCPVTLSLQLPEPMRLPGIIALELVCLTDGSIAARAEFNTGLGDEEDLPPGAHALGPFQMDVDAYATPGPHYVRARLATMSLDTLGLDQGVFEVGTRSRAPVEGWRGRLTVAAPQTVAAGETVEVDAGLTLWPATDRPVFVAVGLESEGALYAAAELLLGIESQEGDSTRLAAKGLLGIPAALPPGAYSLVATATGEILDSPRAEQPIEVTGEGGGTRPLSWGRYVSAEGSSHFWRTSETGVLVWDGFPFMPTGVMVRTRYLEEYSLLDPQGNGDRWQEFESRTRALADAGIEDVYLVTGPRGLADVPTAAMQRVVDRFEELGFRYGIEIGGAMGDGYEGYLLGARWRLNECVAGRENAIALPPNQFQYGASALVTLYDEATGELVGARHAPITGDSVALAIEESEETKGRSYSLHVTPLVRVPPGVGAGDVANEGAFRARKRGVCDAIDALRFGDGLRFFMNPLSGDPGLPPASVLPAFPSTFARSFGAWLDAAYDGDIDMLRRCWGAEDVPSFETAGQLVPAAGPKTMLLVDAMSGAAYSFDPGDSAYWADLERFREEAQASALEDMVESVKSIVDVPILIEPAAGEIEAPLPGAEGGTFLRATRGSGLHNISRSARFGPDGVSIASPALPSDLTSLALAVRLAENRQQLRLPWLVATRLRPTAEDMAQGDTIDGLLSQALEWGVSGLYVRWGSDELGDGAAPDLTGYPQLLAAIGQARNTAWTRQAVTAPRLVYAYPPKLRAVAPDVPDERPTALDGAIASAPAVRMGDGRWLVPGSIFEPGPDKPFLVSLPVARRHPQAARELERWAAAWPDAEVWFLGPRRDLGEIPSLDSRFLNVWAACDYGSGQYQRLAEGEGLEFAPRGTLGYPALATRGSTRFFPVEGLDLSAALWLMGIPTPGRNATGDEGHPSVDDWRIEVDFD